MFNWLGNLFPYSDLHSLNLDWILSKMKETAAQAAKAIADSANALAQVIEAKTAAQNAQTAAQNAQTAANNAQKAANNAADSAENAVTVAQAAKSAAETAQSTAETAQSAAETAQSTAETAQSAAETAQTAAQNAVTTLNNKFPIQTADISDAAVTAAKIANGSINNAKISNGSLLLSAFTKSSLYTNVSLVAAGSGYDKTYTGDPLEFEYGPAEKNRVNTAIIRFPADGVNFAVSVPGSNPTGAPLTYRRRLVRSNGQDLIVSVTVQSPKVTFNIDNYADSGLSTFHVYLHTLQMSTSL